MNPHYFHCCVLNFVTTAVAEIDLKTFLSPTEKLTQTEKFHY